MPSYLSNNCLPRVMLHLLQFLLLEVDEQAGVYAALLPLIDRQTFRSTLRYPRYGTNKYGFIRWARSCFGCWKAGDRVYRDPAWIARN